MCPTQGEAEAEPSFWGPATEQTFSHCTVVDPGGGGVVGGWIIFGVWLAAAGRMAMARLFHPN